jgi:hypothetical protein
MMPLGERRIMGRSRDDMPEQFCGQQFAAQTEMRPLEETSRSTGHHKISTAIQEAQLQGVRETHL